MLSVWLDEEIEARLQATCRRLGLSKTEAVKRSLSSSKVNIRLSVAMGASTRVRCRVAAMRFGDVQPAPLCLMAQSRPSAFPVRGPQSEPTGDIPVVIQSGLDPKVPQRRFRAHLPFGAPTRGDAVKHDHPKTDRHGDRVLLRHPNTPTVPDNSHDPKRAATMAKAFSKSATRYCNQRIAAWREDGLSASQQGWLSLRQLFGATMLWTEVLEPFADREGRQAGISSFESFLGNWLGRSRATLDKTRAFLDQAELEWSRSHPGYHQSAEPSEKRMQQSDRSEREALARLAFSGRRSALVTISWAACCHPRRDIRALASETKMQADLIRRLAVLWQVLDY